MRQAVYNYRLHRLLSLLLVSASCLIAFATSTAQASGFIPAPPAIAATSYILMDASSNKVIVEHNADLELPPASLTKMMTSYIAAAQIDDGNISYDDKVRISVKAWKKGGSKMYIREGTEVRVEDLLRGIIIQSGNDASIAMAEFIAGSEDAFADLMNQHAQELGMNNTHFVNATGWPAPNHFTTARDLSKLARAQIFDHPKHYAMYAEKEFIYNEIRQSNRNLLLWRDKSVDGMKTGHTEEAGYCLVASAERDGMRLISVVMGARSEEARANETQKLLTYGFRFYQTHQPYAKGAILNEAKVWMGKADTVKLGVGKDIVVTIPRGQEEALVAAIDIDGEIRAPIQPGQQYGVLTLSLEGEPVAETPLIALEAVPEGSLFKRLWHMIYLFVLSLL